MKQRTISAAIILLVSLVPSLIGGIVFGLAVAAVMSLAYLELLKLIDNNTTLAREYGVILIVLTAILATYEADNEYFPLILATALFVPLVSTLRGRFDTIDLQDWTTVIGATFYLLLPTYAAINLRMNTGFVDRISFQNAYERLPGDIHAAAGLGWFLLALFVTWTSDTAAYLVGKSLGRTKLIPRISPNKTVEGAVGGLVAASIVAVIWSEALGLPIHPIASVGLGLVLGAVGMIGDLCESQLKRRAGIKDSGNAIPGHGGFLDRIDALIFVLVTTWALLPLLT